MKLSDDQKSMRKIKQVDIGVAVDVEGQLRVAVIRDVANKSLEDIQMDIKNFAAKGPKLSVADQNLTNVCWVVSSMGKDASQSVVAVLPRECAGILAVGRMDSTGNSALAATVCHATYVAWRAPAFCAVCARSSSSKGNSWSAASRNV